MAKGETWKHTVLKKYFNQQSIERENEYIKQLHDRENEFLERENECELQIKQLTNDKVQMGAYATHLEEFTHECESQIKQLTNDKVKMGAYATHLEDYIHQCNDLISQHEELLYQQANQITKCESTSIQLSNDKLALEQSISALEYLSRIERKLVRAYRKLRKGLKR
jgi:translation elongation factor EF-1alpha